jgi:hypothetical protein
MIREIGIVVWVIMSIIIIVYMFRVMPTNDEPKTCLADEITYRNNTDLALYMLTPDITEYERISAGRERVVSINSDMHPMMYWKLHNDQEIPYEIPCTFSDDAPVKTHRAIVEIMPGGAKREAFPVYENLVIRWKYKDRWGDIIKKSETIIPLPTDFHMETGM